MTRNLFTAAAAALLASTALLASLEDAEARGFARAGGFHRMSNPVRHVNIARGAVHRGLGMQASHVGRIQRGLQVSKLHAGQTMRQGGNLRQLSQRNIPALNRNPLNNRNLPALNNQALNRNPLNSRNLPAVNNQAGSSVKSANLTPGPRSMQNQPQGRRYGDVGMNNTPQPQPNNNPGQQANNTPKTNGGSPQNNGKPNGLPKDHLTSQGNIPIWISTPVNWGITRVIPVYGPVKTTVDTYRTLKPKIEQTLQNSELSQKLHEEAIKAAAEAAKARNEQGAGVFQPTSLNDPALMDP